jgi:hypothetical protein
MEQRDTSNATAILEWIRTPRWSSTTKVRLGSSSVIENESPGSTRISSNLHLEPYNEREMTSRAPNLIPSLKIHSFG